MSVNSATVWTAELAAAVKAAAVEAGFHLVGIAGTEAGADGGSVDGERFAAWVAAGRAGEMEYLKRRDEAGELLRSGVSGGDSMGQVGGSVCAGLPVG